MLHLNVALAFSLRSDAQIGIFLLFYLQTTLSSHNIFDFYQLNSLQLLDIRKFDVYVAFGHLYFTSYIEDIIYIDSGFILYVEKLQH
jgi:hypothetical protein